MKSLLFAVLVLAGTTLSLSAKAQTNTVGFGFNINQIQNDFGLGIDVVSPYFMQSSIALKLGGNLKWLEHIDETETTWTTYQNLQMGIRSRHYILEERLFIYGEGGSIMLFPNEDFSSEDVVFGGYGLFGFEFKSCDSFGFYFEMGGVGTGARADETANKAIYSNGFLTNVGFRITP